MAPMRTRGARQRAVAHNNRPSTLAGLPAEARNIIYDALINAWAATHGPALAHRGEIVPLGQGGTLNPTILNARKRLVMTPAHRDPGGLVAYQNAMRDLVAPSHISQRFLRELRSRQRNQLVPFIHMDCLDEFMDMFYPMIDEHTGLAITNYVGQPITITFPWVHPHLYDVLPLIDLLRHSPYMNLVTWAYNPAPHFHGALPHPTQIATSIFGTLRNYLDAPNANSFDRVMFRSHNSRHDHNHARLEIWFRQPTDDEVTNGVDDLAWVDGKDWVWPKPPPRQQPGMPPPPPIRAMPRSTPDRARRQSIERFLRAIGFYFADEIRVSWNVFLGVAGKHEKGGKGIRR